MYLALTRHVLFRVLGLGLMNFLLLNVVKFGIGYRLLRGHFLEQLVSLVRTVMLYQGL